MPFSIYFNAIAPVVAQYPAFATAEKWHVATKTSNTFDTFLTMEMVFRYYDKPSQFDITNKRMTLFHMGTDSSTSGVEVVLRKGVNIGDPIQLGLYASDGTAWNEVSSSFVSLNTIGSVANDAFYCLLSYNYNGSNKIINFNVVRFNNATPAKTAPDFSVTINPATNIKPIGNQWGFGSVPQSITSTDGYISTEGYNSYVAQNLEVSFLRTWNVDIPATSSTAATYAMFNSVAPSYSLYSLNKSYTQVPVATTGLAFQLNMTGNAIPTNMFNSAVNPNQQVIATTSISGWQTLNPPNSWNFAIQYGTGAPNLYTFSQTSNLPCLLKGTKILTESGYKLIDDLTLDDILITADGRKINIVEILVNPIYAKEHQAPYIVRKGHYNAIEDLYISPKHCILIDNNRFVEADKLNLEKSDMKDEVIIYYHIKTTDYFKDVIMANGVPVETYIQILTHNEIPAEYKNKDGNRLLIPVTSQ